jgi:transposase
MPKSRPPYPREFREEAVRLARTSGRPMAQIARELGVAWGTLSGLGEAGGAGRRPAQ